LASYKEYFPFLEEYEEVILDEAIPSPPMVGTGKLWKPLIQSANTSRLRTSTICPSAKGTSGPSTVICAGT